MSDDPRKSEIVNQFHDDFLVERLPDSNSTGFSNELEKDASHDKVQNRLYEGFSTGSLGSSKAGFSILRR